MEIFVKKLNIIFTHKLSMDIVIETSALPTSIHYNEQILNIFSLCSLYSKLKFVLLHYKCINITKYCSSCCGGFWPSPFKLSVRILWI